MTFSNYDRKAPVERGQDAPPPSYDFATGVPAGASTYSPRTFPPASSNVDKQYGSFSEKGQRQREQEQYEYQGQQGEPSRSFASPSSSSNDPAESSSDPLNDMSLDAKTALAKFGNPFARNPEWSPSAQDAQLTHLPALDFQLRIKMFFTGPSAEKRAQAPPPSFQRRFQATNPFSAIPFEPVYIPGADKKKKGDKQLLSDGFQPMYPGGLLVPRDVSAADWGRFLEDVTVAGRLTGKQSLVSNVAPITMNMGMTGMLVTRAIEKSMKKGKEPAIFEIVETWQATFFAKRNLDVYILQNGERRTARSPNAPIPSATHPVPAQLQRSNTSSSSSSSSSETPSQHHEPPHPDYDPRPAPAPQAGFDRRGQREQRRAMRRQGMPERRTGRRGDRQHDGPQRKFADMPDLPVRGEHPAGLVGAAPSTSASSQPRRSRRRDRGAKGGGFLLVIAPLPPSSNKPRALPETFMW